MALLKILHFLALAVGIGGGIANGIVVATASANDPALVGAIRSRIGRAGFVALITLWITGVWMAFAGGYADSGMGFWFWAKMFFVLVMTACSLTIQITMRRPSPGAAARARAQTLSKVILACAILAVVCAVIEFR